MDRRAVTRMRELQYSKGLTGPISDLVEARLTCGRRHGYFLRLELRDIPQLCALEAEIAMSGMVRAICTVLPSSTLWVINGQTSGNS